MSEAIVTGILILGDAIKHPLKAMINSYLPYIDKLLIYNGSTDGSLEVILSEVGNKVPVKVVQERPPVDFGRWRNECLDMIDTPWAFYFFSDEVLEANMTPEMFRDFLKRATTHAFYLCRWNEPVGVDYPDKQANIVRKGTAKYVRRIHEILMPPPTETIPDVHMRIVHKLKPIEEIEKRDRRWMEIDRETEMLHRNRKEIQERLRVEREAVYGGNTN